MIVGGQCRPIRSFGQTGNLYPNPDDREAHDVHDWEAVLPAKSIVNRLTRAN